MRNFGLRFGTAETADFNGDGHYNHDVDPFILAQLLGEVPAYYDARPILIEGEP